MRRRGFIQAAAGAAAPIAAGQSGGRIGPGATRKIPPGVNAKDPLLDAGCLDVTEAPYFADPSGNKDSTAAIQRAVNDGRDYQYVCFFPAGTYLIFDTISCEQPVQKLDKPRFAAEKKQSYWDIPNRTFVLAGSTSGKRPVIKLAPGARGFNDPLKPKIAIYIWAQTRDNAPGKEEPEWGKEQPNISFNHIFKGIDIDVRGHAGAIGIRHSGSQGSTLQDSTIHAEGAYAGMTNCCGQGGGTHNVEVTGGRYGIVIDPGSRFPLLNACVFKGQTEAAIRYTNSGSQVPTLLVGCLLEPAGACAIDLSTERVYAGVSMVDCVVAMKAGGVLCKTRKGENIFLENTLVQGVERVRTAGPRVPQTAGWTRIARYSSHIDPSVNFINGVQGPGELHDWAPAEKEPSFAEISAKHYLRCPSFEDRDAVSVRSFGARGDGISDDTKAFEKAIAAHDKIFVPKGNYLLTGTLRLRPATQLFAFSREFAAIGSVDLPRAPGEAAGEKAAFSLETVARADASPGLWFLSVRGRVNWKSGAGVYMLTSSSLAVSGSGGGKLYGVMAMRRQLLLHGIQSPTSFYALNVERVVTNPQSEIRDCAHLRFYYYKVEAATHYAAEGDDANTPCRIANSRDVRVYCMCGVVWNLGDRPMLDVTDSDDVAVAQLKTLRPGDFPLLRETRRGTAKTMPSSTECALFARDEIRKGGMG